MAITDNLVKVHRELLDLAKEMSASLVPAKVATDAETIRKQLSAFAGKLSVHLAMEDKSFYPRLLASTDSKVVATAKRFLDEVGGLGKAFSDYNGKWLTAKAIQADANGFIAESKKIFAALGDRIAKEEKELYPLDKG
ncbi:MAG: hemerythrin domain-containing protein [Deltaproteobacteria bacterium]|nr:hemerythrin domain-containing protein [Deltaproteobacteria bacterium]